MQTCELKQGNNLAYTKINNQFPDENGNFVVDATTVGLESFEGLTPETLPVSTDVQDLIEGKQDELVSGTNIKTINGETLLGEGNLDIDVDLGNAVLYTEQTLVESEQKQGRLNLALDFDFIPKIEFPIEQFINVGLMLSDGRVLSTSSARHSDYIDVSSYEKIVVAYFYVKNLAYPTFITYDENKEIISYASGESYPEVIPEGYTDTYVTNVEFDFVENAKYIRMNLLPGTGFSWTPLTYIPEVVNKTSTYLQTIPLLFSEEEKLQARENIGATTEELVDSKLLAKQEKLVSNVNINTINDKTLLSGSNINLMTRAFAEENYLTKIQQETSVVYTNLFDYENSFIGRVLTSDFDVPIAIASNCAVTNLIQATKGDVFKFTELTGQVEASVSVVYYDDKFQEVGYIRLFSGNSPTIEIGGELGTYDYQYFLDGKTSDDISYLRANIPTFHITEDSLGQIIEKGEHIEEVMIVKNTSLPPEYVDFGKPLKISSKDTAPTLVLEEGNFEDGTVPLSKLSEIPLLYTPQVLTEEQKQQARNNIGIEEIESGKISDKIEFTSDDLVDNKITINHARNSLDVIISLYSNDNSMVIPTEVTIINESSIELNLTNIEIIGTWKVVIQGGDAVISGVSSKKITIDDLSTGEVIINYQNAIDYDDLSDWELNGWIDQNNNVSTAYGDFVETNYIEIPDGVTKVYGYTIDSNNILSVDDILLKSSMIASYDAEKNFISSSFPVGGNNLVSGAKFIRFPLKRKENFETKNYFISFESDLASKTILTKTLGLREANEELIKYYKDFSTFFSTSSTSSVNQWKDKKWYAYGSSLTSDSWGKYTTPLSTISGMLLTNKGIPGGGITNIGGHSQGQVKSAIMNTSDGKLEADLITLEVGANDNFNNLDLIGTVYDMDDSTFAGCLNQCIRYLLENTDAQIAVTFSGEQTQDVTTEQGKEYFMQRQMTEECCKLNRIYFLSPDNGLGFSRISRADNKYVYDNIHNTELGGEIIANSLWYQIRNIPSWIK